jgi:hypothetical protein
VTLAFEKDSRSGARTARTKFVLSFRYEIRKGRGGVVAECYRGETLVARKRVRTFKAAEAWCNDDVAGAR